MKPYLDEIDYQSPEFGDFYDELPLWSAPFGLMLLDRVPIKPGGTILDLGAGTGFLSLELAQRCGPATTVIAVDPWPSAMARLRRKVQWLDLHNVRLIEQDAAALDLPDASIDLIVSNLGINNFDRVEEVLQNCFRMAKPGAKILLTTNLVGHMQEFYHAFHATLVELGLNEHLAALDKHIQHRGTVELAIARLERAGFADIGATTDSFQMRFADGSALFRHHFIRLAFVPGWKSVVPAKMVDQTFEALERRLNTLARERGELALAIPATCIEARRPVT